MRRKTAFENSDISSSQNAITVLRSEYTIPIETIGHEGLQHEFDFQDRIASSKVGVVARIQERFIEFFSQCEDHAVRIVPRS